MNNNIIRVDSPFPFDIRRSVTGLVLIKGYNEVVYSVTNRISGESLTDEEYNYIINKKMGFWEITSRNSPFTLTPSYIRWNDDK